jgi:hypothetical protein
LQVPALLLSTVLTVLLAGTVPIALSHGTGSTNTRSIPCHPAVVLSRLGRIGGIQPPGNFLRTRAACDAVATGEIPPAEPYQGTPPLLYRGGSVMGTSGTILVTPIYWAPTGYSFSSTYKTLTDQFVTDAASASSTNANVFASLTQYRDGAGFVHYRLAANAAVTDTTTYPSGGCTPDTGQTYTDGAGYTACVTDAQVQTEVAAEVTRLGLPRDLNHMYLIFLPQGVESCFDRPDNAQNGACTISSVGGSYCGYHSYFGSTTIYALLPYAVEDNAGSGETCSTDGGVLAGGASVGNESPNGNLDADTVISVMSHEMSESITDPRLNAWIDAVGNENGDDCAYTYGDTASFGGTPGAYYNQTINGHHYFIQEELSNANYAADPNYSCVQAALIQRVTFTSRAPADPSVSSTYKITGLSSSGLPVTVSTGEFADGLCVMQGSKSGSTVTFEASGACTIVLEQTGTSTYAPSALARQVIYVGHVSSTTMLRLSATKVRFGREPAVRLGITVAPFFRRMPVSGSVSIQMGTRTLCHVGLTSTRGSCWLRKQSLLPGPHVLVARFSGSAHVLGSRSVQHVLTIAKDPSRTTLTASMARATYGHEQSVSFSSSVTAPLGGVDPTGIVVVHSAGFVLCTYRLVNGHGGCTLLPDGLAKGAHSITATYRGNGLLDASVSPPVKVTIG